MSGDLSDYSGTLRVRTHAATSVVAKRLDGLFLKSPVLDGSLVCDEGTYLALTSTSGFKCRALTLGANIKATLTTGTTVTVGDLTIGDGVTLDVAFDSTAGTAAKVVVTNSLTLAGTVRLPISAQTLPESGCSLELLQVPAGVALSKDSFVLDISGLPSYFSRYVSLVVRDDGEEGKTLCLTMARMVTRLGAKCPGFVLSDYTTPTNAAGAYYWSDHLYPSQSNEFSSTTIYYNNAAESYTPTISGKMLEIPALAVVFRNITHSAFSTSAGLSTSHLLSDGASFQLCTGSTDTKPQCRNLDDGTLHRIYRINGGTLELFGTSVTTFLIYETTSLNRIESEIIGSAPMKLTTLNYASKLADNRAYHEFTALNTNYTGRIAMTVASNSKTDSSWGAGVVTVPNMTQCVGLYVRDGRNLGGACASYTYNALELEQYSRLMPVDGDVTLSAGLNRGLAIGNIGRIVVTNYLTCTVNWPITLHGKLLKEGAGTLALGGTEMKFGGADQVITPTAGSNLVQVAAGFLKVTNAAALDGAALTLDDGAGLAVNVGATADEALRLVKDGSSLTASGAIPVRLDGSAPTQATTTTVLCTTKTAGLTFNVQRGSKLKGVSIGDVRAVKDANDVYTYSVDVERRGMTLLLL